MRKPKVVRTECVFALHASIGMYGRAVLSMRAENKAGKSSRSLCTPFTYIHSYCAWCPDLSANRRGSKPLSHTHTPRTSTEHETNNSQAHMGTKAHTRKPMQVLATEEARELVKAYTLLVGQLDDFENENIEAWGASIEASVEAKLKKPLLVQEADRLLRVNFDPLIVRLLREVKYFLLLGLRVPESALEVFGRGELFRRHMGNLDLIVHMHNNVEMTLLPVERPLLQLQLERIDQLLAEGIGGANSVKRPPEQPPKPGVGASKSGGNGGGSKVLKTKAGQNAAGSKKGKVATAAGGG